nr:MAG TPA: hypothetical protein [Caudoviricetes sp.]
MYFHETIIGSSIMNIYFYLTWYSISNQGVIYLLICIII